MERIHQKLFAVRLVRWVRFLRLTYRFGLLKQAISNLVGDSLRPVSQVLLRASGTEGEAR